MRALAILILVSTGFLPGYSWAATAKVIKVLPHFLDDQGRVALSPSLYERDAYQAELRANPEKVHGLRFNIHWKSTYEHRSLPRLRLEARGSRAAKAMVFEKTLEGRKRRSRWTRITLDDETHKQLGDVIAWRVTLWDGDRLLAEQRSFLW